jgi:PAS domain S-box-containing protein
MLLQDPRRLNEAMELAGLGMFEFDIATDQSLWSDQAYINLGYVPGEVTASVEAFLDRVHPEDQEQIRTIVDRAWNELTPIQFEHRVAMPDGSPRWLATRLECAVDESGTLARLFGTSLDVTDRKRFDAAMGWHLALVESSSDAIIGADPDGTITSWNKGAQELYGYTEEEIVGTPMSALCPDGKLDARTFGEIRRGQSVRDVRTTRRRQDGSLVDVSISASPVIDAIGTIIGMSAIVREVTLRREPDDSCAPAQTKARDKRDEVDRMRRSFLSSISHEVRTPLTNILGYLELLRDDPAAPLSADRASIVAAIERNADRLNQLMLDLLLSSQIAAGNLGFLASEVDIARVVRDALSATANEAGRRDHGVFQIVGLSLGSVNGDAALLECAITSVLDNAMKFTPSGGEIEIETLRHEDGVRIVVRDSGIGILPENTEKIFTPFFRGQDSEAMALSGTGLGLPIARAIIEGHNGTIVCSPENRQGTSMVIDLPYRGVEPTADLSPTQLIDRASHGAPLRHVAPSLSGKDLTKRELEVVVLLQSGLDAAQISRRLAISLHTTRDHLKHVRAKFDVNTQLQAVLKAAALGLLPDLS